MRRRLNLFLIRGLFLAWLAPVALMAPPAHAAQAPNEIQNPAARDTSARSLPHPPTISRTAILVLAMVLAGLGAFAVPLSGPGEEEDPEARALRW